MKIIQSVPLFLLAVGLLGCGRSNSPKDAVESLAKAFPKAAADDPVGAIVRIAVESARSNDVETAAVSLQSLRSTPSLTPEQRTAVQDAMGSLQTSLANRAEAGDVAAQRALDAIRAGGSRR